MGWLSDFVSDPVGTVTGSIDKVVSNPIPALASWATGNPAGLLSYASPMGGGQPTSYVPFNQAGNYAYQPSTDYSGLLSLIPGLIQSTGGLLQAQTSKEAAKKAAELAQASGQRAQQMSQFRPIGTTTTFGTSNFQIDPTTGQLTSAGYSLSPQAQAMQEALMGATRTGLSDISNIQNVGRSYLGGAQGAPIQALGQQFMGSNVGQPLTALGAGYLAASPEQAAADWMAKQQAVLQPGRETALAGVRNKLFQTGRTGLATAQGGTLGAANPEMQAYYNALAQQDAQLAAQAAEQGRAQQQFGAGLYQTGTGLTQAQQLAGAGLYGTGLGLTQQGIGFGQGLLSGAFAPFTAGLGASSALESLGQQPLSLSSQLAQQQAAANAAAGRLSMSGDLAAASAYLTPEYQLNPLAKSLSGLGMSTGIGGVNPQTGTGTGLLGGLYNLSRGLDFSGNAPSWTTGTDVIPESTFTGGDGASWNDNWWA